MIDEIPIPEHVLAELDDWMKRRDTAALRLCAALLEFEALKRGMDQHIRRLVRDEQNRMHQIIREAGGDPNDTWTRDGDRLVRRK